jgi:hypothetical protein
MIDGLAIPVGCREAEHHQCCVELAVEASFSCVAVAVVDTFYLCILSLTFIGKRLKYN